MPRGHIDKATRLLSSVGVDEPVLGYSMVKVEPVPERLRYLLDFSPGELEEDSRVGPIYDLAKSLSAFNSASHHGSSIKGKVVSREGSLIVVVALIGIFVGLFREEIRDKLKSLAKGKGTGPEEAHELYQEILEILNRRNGRIHQHTKTLRDGTVDILDLDPDTVYAQGRLGPSLNLEKFLNSLTASRNQGRDIKDRLVSLRTASNQAECLYSALNSPQDKIFLLALLNLRMRGRIKTEGDKPLEREYDAEVDKILRLRDRLEREVGAEY